MTLYDDDTLDPPEQPDEFFIDPQPVPIVRSEEELLEDLHGSDT